MGLGVGATARLGQEDANINVDMKNMVEEVFETMKTEISLPGEFLEQRYPTSLDKF
jgi:hypothetical protein